MNKKIIGAILCFCIMTTGAIPAMEISKELNLEEIPLLTEQKTKTANEKETLYPYVFITSGPISKSFSEVELLNGSSDEIKIIERNLNRKLIRASIFFNFIMIPVNNLDFTVYYSSEIRNGTRFSYYSLSGNATYDEDGILINITNATLTYNDVHKVNVENFTGNFLFFRAKIFRSRLSFLRPLFGLILQVVYLECIHRFFIPARFAFIGYCDNITYLPLYEQT